MEKIEQSPVISYKLPPDEIEKRYGPVQPPKSNKDNVWPKAGQPNLRRKKAAPEEELPDEEEVMDQLFDEEDLFTEEDYTDPEWGMPEIRL